MLEDQPRRLHLAVDQALAYARHGPVELLLIAFPAAQHGIEGRLVFLLLPGQGGKSGFVLLVALAKVGHVFRGAGYAVVDEAVVFEHRHRIAAEQLVQHLETLGGQQKAQGIRGVGVDVAIAGAKEMKGLVLQVEELHGDFNHLMAGDPLNLPQQGPFIFHMLQHVGEHHQIKEIVREGQAVAIELLTGNQPGDGLLQGDVDARLGNFHPVEFRAEAPFPQATQDGAIAGTHFQGAAGFQTVASAQFHDVPHLVLGAQQAPLGGGFVVGFFDVDFQGQGGHGGFPCGSFQLPDQEGPGREMLGRGGGVYTGADHRDEAG